MRTPVIRWLSWRVRLALVVVFLISGFLPPYVPKSALTAPEDAQASMPDFLYVEEGFLMKTSSLGEQGTRLAYGEALLHTVVRGDTINSIASRYHISVETIRWANNLSDNAPLQPDQELIILPVDGVLHIVRRGQTLARISQLYDVPQDAIAKQNKLKGGFIVAGQELIIPNGKPIPGLPPAIASAESTLRFTDRLPDKNITLGGKKPPSTTSAQRPSPGTAAGAAERTSGILQMPCKNCFYTQYYSATHFAVDIQTRGGGPIFAAEAGTVIRAEGGWNGGYGNVIEIDHGNGLVTLYGHNKELYVKVGDTVERGQTIAWMGNTGLVHGATGIHTHFEVRVNGVKKNPLLYLE